LTAGYTYCAIASLAFLNRLPGSLSLSPTSPKESAKPVSHIPALTSLPATIRWLVSRQVEYQPEEQGEENALERPPLPIQQQRDARAENFKSPPEPRSLAELSLRESECVGFNGRCNKHVDTCYTFWVAASLDVCMGATFANIFWLILTDNWSKPAH
jgi:geranylgeranyl transferase type-1 subunit beta